MDIIKEIKDHIEKTGERVGPLEDRAGVSRSTIYRLLSGERTDIRLSTAEKIRKAIDAWEK